jgi:hypothetical protein
MSKADCGARLPKPQPLDLAESHEMLRKLLDQFKDDVVNFVLAGAFPEAKAAAERVKIEEEFIGGILLRLEQDGGLTREEVIAHLAKRYRNDPAERRTAWERILGE